MADLAASEGGPKPAPVVIKKYANRRLYNTSTSIYVTLDHLSTMVKEKTDSWSTTPRPATTSRARC